MFLLPPRDDLVVSPKDLGLASSCEFALVRGLDALLGRSPAVAVEPDGMLARVRELGDQHEQRELLRLSAEHRGRVVQFGRPAYTREGLTAAHEQTLAALRSEAEVVVQGTFFDGGFVGHADFLERTEAGWLVCDTKLARTESVPALLQIAAYAAQLRAAGIPTAPVARLLLGSGLASDHALDDLLPVYRARRARLDAVLAEHRAEEGAAAWGDARWLACGRCEVCQGEAEAARDVILVAGVRMPTRRRLHDAGVRTVEELAAREDPVPGVRATTLERLRRQAVLQAAQDADPAGTVLAEVVDPAALAKLPPPSPGDVFFDFEGDPLWAERGSGDWGLEYLFGMVEVDSGTPAFRTFWAHDRAQEKQALVDFVAHLTQRRQQWPDLHVYHYAAYEKSALLRLAVRHAVCEEEIDQFLREGVFVDLYTVVKAGVRVSQRSYSIKKLEPLYMPERDIDLQSGGDSIVVYHEFCAAREVGDDVTAAERLQQIHDYNRDDCLSTLRLRDWLLAQLPGSASSGAADGAGSAAGAGGRDPMRAPVDAPEQVVRPAQSAEREARVALEASLRALLGEVKPHERTPEQQALALAASAVQFHAREDKPFWWRHFDRLRAPVADWLGDPGVFVVITATVEGEWHAATSRQRPRRRLRLVGEPLGGALLGTGGGVSAVYGVPSPPGMEAGPQFHHAKSPATVTVVEASEAIDSGGHVLQELLVEELMPKDGEQHDSTPVALVPSGVIPAGSIDGAISEVASGLASAWPSMPPSPAVDLLLRRPPRLRSGSSLPAVADGDFVAPVTRALLDLDGSYLAIQGPPGTGKTHVASHVIADLVLTHGWRVGVCAQSHAAIENVLDAVVRAGVPADRVGKMTKETETPSWTHLESADRLAEFAAGQPGGYVIGGTAWDLTNTRRVAREQLDLVVIDEAGQYSLAKTLAVSVAGSRLLLLGDPQQLPQVTQGSHPDPVDLSALGWLIGGAPVLPPELGYFLSTTWRMHPGLAAAVSRLSYAGQLSSRVDVTRARALAGVDPGIHVRTVEHHDNQTSSVEEAQAVVDLVHELLGRQWDAPDEEGPARPLTPRDIIIITPYNAQVAMLTSVLGEAGLGDVAVGTVDKFQGREAPVAILSMAASAPGDVSRGIEFLLDRNRLNVAISRAKHAAYVVRSPRLTDLAPRTPAELTALGAFIGLCEQAVSTADVSGSVGERSVAAH